jgi:hypothetical protein
MELFFDFLPFRAADGGLYTGEISFNKEFFPGHTPHARIFPCKSY